MFEPIKSCSEKASHGSLATRRCYRVPVAIESANGKRPLSAVAPPAWGELVGQGERALVVRFVLDDRIVSIPIAQLRRWEHTSGEPEYLLIAVGQDTVVIEGQELGPIRIALDLGRLAEVRSNHERRGRPGPWVRRLALEAAR
jgi:hypothetical protein